MKLTVSKDDLLLPLSLATDLARSSGGNGNYVYRNVAIKVDEKKEVLNIIGSNGRVEFGGNVTGFHSDQSGGFCLGAKLLALCKTFPEGTEITLETDAETKVVTLVTGKGRYKLNAISEDQFATLDVTPSAHYLDVPGRVLLDMIKQVDYVIPQNDVRYYLNGMLLEVYDKELRTVATDGHRLVICTRPVDGIQMKDKAPVRAIVPHSAVISMASMLADMLHTSKDDTSEEQALVKLTLDGSSMEMKTPFNRRISTTLLDGRFPDYEQVIPRNADRELKMPVSEINDALTRAAIVVDDSVSRSVVLEVSGNLMTVKSTNTDQETSEEAIPVEYSGSDSEEVKLCYNVKYLQDMIKNVSVEKISLQFADPNETALMEADRDPADKQDGNTQYILMPVRL